MFSGKMKMSNSIKNDPLNVLQDSQVCFDAGLWLVLWWMKRPYLKQPSQSMFPVVSLMVRSETKAGYSVSHGTILVLP